ncbi:deoxyguanosinetriphosphate triphosphohydrolase family protein [Treponema parvum]|uniref:deoxyguanosinetriphosphate triphosphohydrolase family protein n=1 Tax=Treponema parvum TaxID=138851 RepID=UPI001AEBF493|nr:dNTP triphosphohydrolase [Treponema parvum]QTQ15285.1 dNTP triphosphohydrolase [Treponema parvum]
MQGLFNKVRCGPESRNWEQCILRESRLYSRGNDIRSDFERDYTRILHCQAYRRLKHKTQVFFSPHNDHVCTRMEHVQHVASVACTIAKYLGLNTELVEAIALAHDMGHAPFGHHGEDCLNGLLKTRAGAGGLKKFWHERNSLFFADYIETLPDPDGIERRLDLTYAVRDGIICHCGEIDQQGIKPRTSAIDLYSMKRPGLIQPYTWEGCVVKIADKIAYLGRDLEDARTYHILDMGAYRRLREIVLVTLGLNDKGKKALRSGKAVNTTVLINDLIVDLCEQSSPEKGLCFSPEYFSFLLELKKFNIAHIYKHWRLVEFGKYATNIIETLYRTLLRTQPYAQNGRIASALRNYPNLCKTFEEWLLKYSDYKKQGHDGIFGTLKYDTKVVFFVNDNESFKKCIIEYISGMTDQYATTVYQEIISF